MSEKNYLSSAIDKKTVVLISFKEEQIYIITCDGDASEFTNELDILNKKEGDKDKFEFLNTNYEVSGPHNITINNKCFVITKVERYKTSELIPENIIAMNATNNGGCFGEVQTNVSCATCYLCDPPNPCPWS